MMHEVKGPYIVGNVIKVHLKRPNDGLEATTDAKIIKVFEPFTLSSVVLIRITCPTFGLEGDMILELFDRRFVMQLREDQGIRPWTSNAEMEYHQFILDGGASKFVAQLNGGGETPEGNIWSTAMDETYLHDHMLDLYKTEVEVDLLLYIEGFPLTDIADYAPRESWQTICEDAIRIINLIGDLGILNENVKTRSFIAHEDMNAENGFKVTMTDFALCKFRREYEDDYDWDTWKAMQDEEGAVGYVMQRRLQGGSVYHRSDRYEKLDIKFKMDD
ncbi:hypothetical protein PENDEC_c039G02274 [Penicillium decumbens]|uniref:Protein kinase domain-containing protein n=1 Tax=Penicillium decumbens TaxID=69771 RepID=A0A1V6NRS9_PENDC|nr:hypothetical protein PENDEC_c039G02274 [Penicillium decumbens]